MSLNNDVRLCGNIGVEPELQYTQSGQPRLRIRMATSETWRDKQGERQEKTEWHTVIVWGKRAEALGGFLKKGDRLLVGGSIEYRQWDDKDGNRRNSTSIKARDIEILSGKRDGGHGAPKSKSTDFSGGASEFDDSFGDDSSIPF
ncbi:MAG: single-stranded DNA-binding protein [Myxococcota bacterium]